MICRSRLNELLQNSHSITYVMHDHTDPGIYPEEYAINITTLHTNDVKWGGCCSFYLPPRLNNVSFLRPILSTRGKPTNEKIKLLTTISEDNHKILWKSCIPVDSTMEPV